MSNHKDQFRLTVVSVSWFSSALLARLFSNLSEKARYPDEIRYLVIDNTNGNDDHVGKLEQLDSSIHIKAIDSKNLKGSWAHAFGLDYATQTIETPYTLVIDPDIHVFKHHWDEFLVNELNKAQAVAIGAPYPFWKLGKYHNFPSPPFLLYKTSVFKTMGLDWTPFPHEPLRRLYYFMARQIVRMGLFCTRRRLSQRTNLKKIAQQLESFFGVCAPDTGWRIAAGANDNSLKSLLFEEVDGMNTQFSQIPYAKALGVLADEFELYQYENEPILTHKYSTSGYLWKTERGRDHQYWIDAIQQIEDEMPAFLKAGSGGI